MQYETTKIFLLEVGQVVYSKAGHDKGLPFVVTFVENGFAYIIDGTTRPIDKPKKKKLKHLQPVNVVDTELAEKLTSGAYLQNATIAKLLKPYKRR